MAAQAWHYDRAVPGTGTAGAGPGCAWAVLLRAVPVSSHNARARWPNIGSNGSGSGSGYCSTTVEEPPEPPNRSSSGSKKGRKRQENGTIQDGRKKLKTDLENAICHKESNVLVEIHAAMFHMLMKDEVTWAEYLCDFLEMTKNEELSTNIATVRRGYYGLIDTDIKLKILWELVEEAIQTSAIREILSDRVDQKQVLNATKRENTRKDKQEQNLNTEIAMKKEENQTDAVQGGHEGVDELVRGKENDKSNISRSRTEGKRHLVRHLETEIEKLSIRSSPLGKDRQYNRYWFFKREGRLFVETADSRE
ncbi:uncharacterized protein [Miscanthus floridulus]|uniref:uncharacterized protein n=1 Tax=Miscanthus floridulus TaxID=154761 RepID=UPI00345B379D